MAGTILDTISDYYNSLTRSGRKLADYIFSNANETQYLSITSLAENSGVSEASITRFCRSIGLSGYNELKLDLAKTLYTNELGDVIDKPQTVSASDTFEVTRRKLHDSYIISLNETIEQMDSASYKHASDLLCSAGKVYCFGQGGSMAIAMEACSLFSTVSSKFVHISDSHLQMMNASLSSVHDVILFFSYSGNTQDGVELLKIAQEHNVPVILVTHFRNCEAAKYATELLICGCNENPLREGSVATKMGQLFIIDCLYYLFCQNDPEHTVEARTTTSRALTHTHI